MVKKGTKLKGTLKRRWDDVQFDLEMAYQGLNNFGNILTMAGIVAVMVRFAIIEWYGDLWIKVPAMIALLGFVISILTHEKKKKEV